MAFTSYNVGDYLVLELYSGDIFEGDYCSGAENRIDLVNASQHNNPNKLGGVYSFYRSEINKVRLMKSKPEDLPTSSIIIPLSEDSKRIKIVEEEYIRLKEMCKNYIFMEHADSKYYDAIEDLNKAETIGIMSFGMEDCRSATIRLLAICTWKQVYLFDMINFRNSYFYPELKDIFESEYVCKVMHNSGHLIDVLNKKYKIFTQNIFDTHVVDLIIRKNTNVPEESFKRFRDISDCLVFYLNFPSSLLHYALQVKLKQWLEKPLNEKLRFYASQLVTYLIVLKDAMQKILFSEVHLAIHNYHRHFSNLDSATFSQRIHSNEISEEIQELIPILKRNTIA